MDGIKEAFNKVKDDIYFLNEEVNKIKLSLEENKIQTSQFSDILLKINEKLDNLDKNMQNSSSTDRQTDTSTQNPSFQTDSTHISTDKGLFTPLKPQYLPLSIGNKGVSTDRQTDTSTDRQTPSSAQNSSFQGYQTHFSTNNSSMKDALEFIDSLDSIKKEIRLKFKRITEQEFLVFSTIYQMEEEYGGADYKSLSKRLNLTESSIRDYVGRLIKKEIPIEKVKINNKSVQLSISRNLKKIVSLPTILQLREV